MIIINIFSNSTSSIFEKEINQVLLEQKNDLTLANQNQIAQQFTPKITGLENDIANTKNNCKLSRDCFLFYQENRVQISFVDD